MVDGIVYHKECAPKKTEARTLNDEPVSEELQKMVDKTTKEFLEEEAKKGTVESYNAYEGDLKEAGEITKKLSTVVKDSKVNFGELTAALSTVNKKTPRKKRVKK